LYVYLIRLKICIFQLGVLTFLGWNLDAALYNVGTAIFRLPYIVISPDGSVCRTQVTGAVAKLLTQHWNDIFCHGGYLNQYLNMLLDCSFFYHLNVIWYLVSTNPTYPAGLRVSRLGPMQPGASQSYNQFRV